MPNRPDWARVPPQRPITPPNPNFPIMIELEVYAVGLRDSDYIQKLNHELEAFAGVRYQVDPNHDIVYFEMGEPAVTLNQISAAFRRIGLHPRFVGQVPPELEVGSGGAQTMRIE